MRVFKETRKFGGQTYQYVTHYFRKVDILAAKARLRKKGHSTRTTRRGNVYHLWARRK